MLDRVKYAELGGHRLATASLPFFAAGLEKLTTGCGVLKPGGALVMMLLFSSIVGISRGCLPAAVDYLGCMGHKWGASMWLRHF